MSLLNRALEAWSRYYAEIGVAESDGDGDVPLHPLFP